MTSHLRVQGILDDRHTQRQVRCVCWRPPGGASEGQVSKFAFKVVNRDAKDAKLEECLNEKDIMLALDSPWHTKLVNT